MEIDIEQELSGKIDEYFLNEETQENIGKNQLEGIVEFISNNNAIEIILQKIFTIPQSIHDQQAPRSQQQLHISDLISKLFLTSNPILLPLFSNSPYDPQNPIINESVLQLLFQFLLKIQSENDVLLNNWQIINVLLLSVFKEQVLHFYYAKQTENQQERIYQLIRFVELDSMNKFLEFIIMIPKSIEQLKNFDKISEIQQSIVKQLFYYLTEIENPKADLIYINIGSLFHNLFVGKNSVHNGELMWNQITNQNDINRLFSNILTESNKFQIRASGHILLLMVHYCQEKFIGIQTFQNQNNEQAHLRKQFLESGFFLSIKANIGFIVKYFKDSGKMGHIQTQQLKLTELVCECTKILSLELWNVLISSQMVKILVELFFTRGENNFFLHHIFQMINNMLFFSIQKIHPIWFIYLIKHVRLDQKLMLEKDFKSRHFLRNSNTIFKVHLGHILNSSRQCLIDCIPLFKLLEQDLKQCNSILTSEPWNYFSKQILMASIPILEFQLGFHQQGVASQPQKKIEVETIPNTEKESDEKKKIQELMQRENEIIFQNITHHQNQDTISEQIKQVELHSPTKIASMNIIIGQGSQNSNAILIDDQVKVDPEIQKYKDLEIQSKAKRHTRGYRIYSLPTRKNQIPVIYEFKDDFNQNTMQTKNKYKEFLSLSKQEHKKQFNLSQIIFDVRIKKHYNKRQNKVQVIQNNTNASSLLSRKETRVSRTSFHTSLDNTQQKKINQQVIKIEQLIQSINAEPVRSYEQTKQIIGKQEENNVKQNLYIPKMVDEQKSLEIKDLNSQMPKQVLKDRIFSTEFQNELKVTSHSAFIQPAKEEKEDIQIVTQIEEKKDVTPLKYLSQDMLKRVMTPEDKPNFYNKTSEKIKNTHTEILKLKATLLNSYDQMNKTFMGRDESSNVKQQNYVSPPHVQTFNQGIQQNLRITNNNSKNVQVNISEQTLNQMPTKVQISSNLYSESPIKFKKQDDSQQQHSFTHDNLHKYRHMQNNSQIQPVIQNQTRQYGYNDSLHEKQAEIRSPEHSEMLDKQSKQTIDEIKNLFQKISSMDIRPGVQQSQFSSTNSYQNQNPGNTYQQFQTYNQPSQSNQSIQQFNNQNYQQNQFQPISNSNYNNQFKEYNSPRVHNYSPTNNQNKQFDKTYKELTHNSIPVASQNQSYLNPNAWKNFQN